MLRTPEQMKAANEQRAALALGAAPGAVAALIRRHQQLWLYLGHALDDIATGSNRAEVHRASGRSLAGSYRILAITSGTAATSAI